MPNKSYIYVRDNAWYEFSRVFKLGFTENVFDRNSTYKTSEITCGKFILILEVDNAADVESKLKIHFHKNNVYNGGGMEFFGRTILNQICPYLDNVGIQYKKLTDADIAILLDERKLDVDNIADILHCDVNKNIQPPNINNIENIPPPNTNTIENAKNAKCNKNKSSQQIDNEDIKLSDIKINKLMEDIIPAEIIANIEPRDYQFATIQKIVEEFKISDIANINWACGLGKALLSIFIVKYIQGCNSVLIGVPSIELQRQFKREIIRIYPNRKNILCVSSDDGATSDKADVKKFIEDNIEYPKFVITTYSSCAKIPEYLFDFKIGDEAHHLSGAKTIMYDDNGNKIGKKIDYMLFHEIKSRKTLFMTATVKYYNNTDKIPTSIANNTIISSMNDESIFGKCIDTKSVKWAIDNKKITDYSLVVARNTNAEIFHIINTIMKENKDINPELFLSAYMTIRSIMKYPDLTHVLIYANSIKNTERIKDYLGEIYSAYNQRGYISELYIENAHSELTAREFNTILTNFKKSKFGIVVSVFKLGEGFDMPELNGVVFAETMISEIRVVQSALRPNRLNRTKPDKKSYIIVPTVIDEVKNNEKNEFSRKDINIISKLGNTDDSIIKRITTFNPFDEMKATRDIKTVEKRKSSFLNEENVKQINQIKLSLIPRNLLTDNDNINKHMIYEIIKETLAENKILTINDYKKYIKTNTTLNQYISDHKILLTPYKYFGKSIWKGWHDYLGLEFNITEDEWINVCNGLLIKSEDDYYAIASNDMSIPHNPKKYFNNTEIFMKSSKFVDNIFDMSNEIYNTSNNKFGGYNTNKRKTTYKK